MRDEELLSSTQAAALLHVSRWTVERWVRENGLPAKVEVHGRRRVYRFRRADLLAYARRWFSERWS